MIAAIASPVLAIAAVVVVGYLVFLAPFEEPAVAQDEALMRQTLTHLGIVDKEFAALATPDGANPASGFKKTDCTVESGGVVQPWVRRSWNVAPSNAPRTADDVARVLVRDGWTGSTTPGPAGSYHLQRDHAGWTSWVVVTLSYERDEVFIDAGVLGEEPCRLADGDSR